MRRTWPFLVAALALGALVWAGETAKTTLKIVGMTWGGCVPTVNLQLKKTEGVVAYEVSFEKGEALVSYDAAKTTPAKIAEFRDPDGLHGVRQGDGGRSRRLRGQFRVRGDDWDNRQQRRSPRTSDPLPSPADVPGGERARLRRQGAALHGRAREEARDRGGLAESSGTVLGVVWKEPQPHARASSVVGSLFHSKGLSVTALEGLPRSQALQDFAARAQWYRGQDVNKLSEQEGLVFTERMAKRVESRTKLSPASSAARRADLRNFCVDWLVGQAGRDTKVLVELAAKYMDPAQLKAYEEALKEGFQVLPGEPLS